METTDLSHHILSRYNEDLQGLRSGVLQMGASSNTAAKWREGSLLGRQPSRRRGGPAGLPGERAGVAIDEDCSRILATRNPTASDLRLIVTVIKTITDLERIGDEAEKLGHIATRLANLERPADRYREIKHLGDLVGEMVHGALDAFARLDTEAALAVARRDRIVTRNTKPSSGSALRS